MAQFLSLFVLLSVVLSTPEPERSGALTGRVIDAAGRPIIGASVAVLGTAHKASTIAPEGRFAIGGIAVGSHNIQIASPGHTAINLAARIDENRTTDVGTIALMLAHNIDSTARALDFNGGYATLMPQDKDEARERVGDDRRLSSELQLNALEPSPAQPADLGGASVRGGRAEERVSSGEIAGVIDGSNAVYSAPSGSGAATVDAAVAQSPVFDQSISVPLPRKDEAKITTTTSAVVQPSIAMSKKGGEMLRLDVSREPASLPPAAGSIRQDPTSGEDYAKIYENEFLASHVSPLSTFSIDVDRASYSNVRRMITNGNRPQADAVRIEEMVNYFDYGYPEPDDDVPFGINTEMSECPWAPEHKLVRIGLQGKRMMGEVLPPSNLTFLIDVSGSMSSPDKLPLLKQGFKLLINQMRRQDSVAIVVYAGAAGMVLPMTSGADKNAIHGALDRLASGGSTAGAAGIELAYKLARESFVKGGNNRVILATDGDFNVGISSQDALVKLIEERRKDGIFLTVLGFGTGNLQDAKMEQLADKGNGNYAYIDNINEAKKVFVDELGATIFTIAKDVKIQVVFSPERVESYRLIGYENRMLATEDFEDDLKDAGELGAGHSVTALYEIVPRGAQASSLEGWQGRKDTLDLPSDWKEGELVRVRLRYKLPDSDVSSLIEGPVVDRGTRLTKTSDDFRFAAAVAQFGMLLRDSRHKGASTYDNVLRLANGSKGLDTYGYRKEFIELVTKARDIATTASR